VSNYDLFYSTGAKDGTYDFLIVGAGFAGSVCAERLASVGYCVLVLGRRPHIGCNAFDSKRVFATLAVLPIGASTKIVCSPRTAANLYLLPINRLTLNALYNLKLDEVGGKSPHSKKRDQDQRGRGPQKRRKGSL
jgi:UDP-galactopyranose mutase